MINRAYLKQALKEAPLTITALALDRIPDYDDVLAAMLWCDNVDGMSALNNLGPKYFGETSVDELLMWTVEALLAYYKESFSPLTLSYLYGRTEATIGVHTAAETLRLIISEQKKNLKQ